MLNFDCIPDNVKVRVVHCIIQSSINSWIILRGIPWQSQNVPLAV